MTLQNKKNAMFLTKYKQSSYSDGKKKALHLLRVNPLSLLQQNLLQSMLSATSATLYKHTCCYTCLICNWDNCLLTSALSDKEKCHQKPKASFPIFLTGSIIDIGEISEG